MRDAAKWARIGGPDWRARAWEILGPKLTAAHRDLMGPLFELAPRPPSERDRKDEERLLEIAMGRYTWATSWLRACAVRALKEMPPTPRIASALETAAHDADRLVAETAAAPASAGGPRLITIEKVLILRRVSLFASIPHEVLVGVASLLRERWVAPDERIFDKGDLGDSLFVIVSGRVRVHDGEATYRHLVEHEFFGELSLLDAEPRSASVTAVAPTHLFRLGQNDFYALLEERPEIMHAINRVLCKLVRHAPPAA